MNTSLFYEVLLYLNSFYFGMFGVCEVGIALLKYAKFTYSGNAMLTELLLLIFLCLLESGRIWLGRRGNFSERAIPVILSTLLILPAAAAVVYFLIWQAYILRLEYILCSVQLVLHATELVFAFLSIMPSSRKPVYD